MLNSWTTYRQFLYFIIDQDYGYQGVISIESDGRYIVQDTAGKVIGNRKTGDSAIRAVERRGYTVVSSAWYGIEFISFYWKE